MHLYLKVLFIISNEVVTGNGNKSVIMYSFLIKNLESEEALLIEVPIPVPMILISLQVYPATVGAYRVK